MGIFSFLGFGGNKVKDALLKGAAVIDVRTVNEYDGGKVPGSINIPVERIASSIDRLKGMRRPLVFCCTSGSRSGKAVSIAKQNGIKEVYNGGSWLQVLKLLNS